MTSRFHRRLPARFCNWIYLVTNFKLFPCFVHFVSLVLIHFVAVVVVSEINLFACFATTRANLTNFRIQLLIAYMNVVCHFVML